MNKFILAGLAMIATAGAAHAGTWAHEEDKDKMRGTVTTWDFIESENEANFSFPYDGGSKLAVSIRKKDGKLDDVIILIRKGQFNCGIYSCTAAVKFGDSKVENVKLLPPANYAIDALFVSNKTAFAKKLTKGGKMIIELPFYQEGPTQFEFDIPAVK